MSATLYLPLPFPARYSRASPLNLPESRLSKTSKTRSVSFVYLVIASIHAVGQLTYLNNILSQAVQGMFSGAARRKWFT
jgi:hypothetical protein